MLVISNILLPLRLNYQINVEKSKIYDTGHLIHIDSCIRAHRY